MRKDWQLPEEAASIMGLARHLETAANIGQQSAPMPDWQDRLHNENLRKAARIADRSRRTFAIAMVVIAIPLALLYMVPVILGFFAPPLDPKVDLYAVNRPPAFTFPRRRGQ